jgi:hypothetical protein
MKPQPRSASSSRGDLDRRRRPERRAGWVEGQRHVDSPIAVQVEAQLPGLNVSAKQFGQHGGAAQRACQPHEAAVAVLHGDEAVDPVDQVGERDAIDGLEACAKQRPVLRAMDGVDIEPVLDYGPGEPQARTGGGRVRVRRLRSDGRVAVANGGHQGP